MQMPCSVGAVILICSCGVSDEMSLLKTNLRKKENINERHKGGNWGKAVIDTVPYFSFYEYSSTAHQSAVMAIGFKI